MSLDRLVTPAFLCLAAKKARKYLTARQWYHDRSSQEAFCGALTFRAWQLSNELQTGEYKPQARTVFAAPKRIMGEVGKEVYQCRPLAIQAFRDEVVETALVMTLADAFESSWGDPEKDSYPRLCSYGNRVFRPKSGEDAALSIGSSHLYRDWPEDYARFVKETALHFNAALRKCKAGEYVVLFSSDVSNFYPSIDRRRLVRLVNEKVEIDEEFRTLLETIFGRYEVRGCDFTQKDAASLASTGLLQGPVHSGFWANVYLATHDEWVKDGLTAELANRGIKASVDFYARYVDDFHIVLKVQQVAGLDDATSVALDQHTAEAISTSLAVSLGPLGLELSSAKTSILVQDSAGSLLTTGQVAERMEAITKKSYFPLPPEDLKDLEAEVRFLFGSSRDQADARLANHGLGVAPVLDNPGVREHSRKRFAAGKWLRIARDLDRVVPGWIEKNRDFASELLREWLVDPTQVQLLQRAFEIGLRSQDVTLFVKRLNGLKRTESRPFYDFVWSYLLDQNVFLNRDWKLAYDAAVEEAIREGKHPVLVQRAIAWRLKNKRRIDRWEGLVAAQCKSDYWTCRQHLWGLTKGKISVTPYELGALIVSVRPSDRIVASLVGKALQVSPEVNQRAQLIRSVLQRRPKPILDLSETWNLKVPELKAFGKEKGSGEHLYRRILNGEFRSPIAWLRLADALGRFLENEDMRIAAGRGLIHPFSLRMSSDLDFSISDSPAILTAYSTGAESRSEPSLDVGWAYPVGLILRAAATGQPQDLIGATPISRFSMAGTFLWLAQRAARLGTHAADLLDRLAWWPGSRMEPFPTIEAFLATVAHLTDSIASTSKGDAVLSDIVLRVDRESKEERAPHCIALCQLRAAPNEVSDASVRRALSITRTILRERQTDDTGLNLVVFPEMSVPRSSMGTLCRFARMTGCVVLAGLELVKDVKGKRHLNELIWIVPIDKQTGRVAVLRQEKIFPTSKELKLIPPVIPAEPPVVWRLVTGRDRMAAINCYEFTYLPLRELMRGRVELMMVSANNQDVTTFDNLIESTHYDLYSHVVLVNSEHHGGSAVRAPYRRPQDRRIFDIHGADLFSVNVCFVDLGDFRGKPKKEVKSRPAGFKVH